MFTTDMTPPLARDSVCKLVGRGIRALGEQGSTIGVSAHDIAAIDSVTIAHTAYQLDGTDQIDSFVVVYFVLRKPYNAQVLINRSTGTATVTGSHK